MITVQHIHKQFGDKVALDNISFDIQKGQIFGFLGPSGSGKTTMIKIITGQLPADSGKSYLLGKESTLLSPEDFEAMGLVSDSSGFFEKMTLENNLLFYAKFFGVSSKEVEVILQKVGLLDSKKTIAEKLSTGMKQRMLLARALINSPKVLFLDEPTSGLDPTTSKRIHELLLELKGKGTTIFLTTHDMAEATFLCDQLVLLNQGNLVEKGSPQDLIHKYNATKKVRVTFEDGSDHELLFSELTPEKLAQATTIHSCEPTLEDIFIQQTGAVLNV
ncbi:ABC transporter ATP-binding protein [Streptococcus suis]|uniref:ABC transporter ATP-binding protein n=1 Tax=Streptococcus suis TaxID=1307 RepID=UPI00209AAA14|nr:ABC transporter ATP-binding protein [Streptococcus suis]MCO8205695.1 ABC transporter ATP-binding protein [Streptococcus suis]MCO8214270.1 ABC transporter ATP-binding protein [Streptococcus suis]MCO8231589.1 ABC transporter ATP-binding protein [Streptococcus suis]MCO8233520.1 ABC transporter ATP-binding protein [Streptococcus suis]MCO8240183.1 ABC transporter ATP-binding protein [Streptococcus suis]